MSHIQLVFCMSLRIIHSLASWAQIQRVYEHKWVVLSFETLLRVDKVGEQRFGRFMHEIPVRVKIYIYN